MRIEPEISGVGVVVLGDFNPAIFTPAWFALHDLLPRSVAENAGLQVAHQQVTAFDADWLHLQVTVDDHYAIDAAAAGTAERLVTLLEENFDGSLKRSEEIIDHVMSLAASKEADS